MCANLGPRCGLKSTYEVDTLAIPQLSGVAFHTEERLLPNWQKSFLLEIWFLRNANAFLSPLLLSSIHEEAEGLPTPFGISGQSRTSASPLQIWSGYTEGRPTAKFISTLFWKIVDKSLSSLILLIHSFCVLGFPARTWKGGCPALNIIAQGKRHTHCKPKENSQYNPITISVIESPNHQQACHQGGGGLLPRRAHQEQHHHQGLLPRRPHARRALCSSWLAHHHLNALLSFPISHLNDNHLISQLHISFLLHHLFSSSLCQGLSSDDVYFFAIYSIAYIESWIKGENVNTITLLGNVTSICWLPSNSKHSTISKFKIDLLSFLQPPLKCSKTAHDCWISECAPQLFVTSGLITPHCVQCICKQCSLVICTRFCLIVLSCICIVA